MKSNLDQHIDAKIKTSFDAYQKQAPTDLWGRIVGKMDLEEAVDKSLDEKVHAAHSEIPIQKAPLGIWQKVEKNLDETPSIDAVLDEKIKDGFLSNTKNIAPAFLWGAISDGLSSSATSIDEVLDNKLKQGFLSQESKKTPNRVWYAVSRQLNIDKTWERISKVLDKEPIVSDWSGRMLAFLASAVLLLLLLKTCTHEPYTIPSTDFVQQLQNKESNDQVLMPLVTKKDPTNTPSDVSKPVIAPLSKKPNNRLASRNSNNSKDTKTKKKKLIAQFPTQRGLHSSSNKLSSNKQVDVSKKVLAVDSKKETSSDNELPIVASEIEKGLLPSHAATSSQPIDSKGTKASPSDANFLKNKEALVAKKQFDIIWLDRSTINPLAIGHTVEPIRLLDEMKLERKAKKNLVEGKLEAGAFMVVNSTMLLNNETREGFDQNSLTTNYFGLAANYGLWASYQIIPKGALVAEFSINADNRQAYGMYQKGVFYIKEWVMKYNRLSLAYKHAIWQTNSKKLVNTKVVAQAGVYVGVMREAKLFYDGVLFFDKQSDYHQFDVGFKVALGQEVLIDKFVLGYGLRSDIGASNIFKGNSVLNGNEDKTNIIHLGGYVLLGYRF